MSDIDDTQPSRPTVCPISDEENLNRRLHAFQIKEDGSPSSGAFTDPSMSVDRDKMRSHAESLADFPTMGLAQFNAGFARSLAQDVSPDPLLLNPAHALVNGNKNKTVAKKFAKASRVVATPKTIDGPTVRVPMVDGNAGVDEESNDAEGVKTSD